jgi:hypothetical protein
MALLLVLNFWYDTYYKSKVVGRRAQGERMFGHDNQDDNDSQITLPPVDETLANGGQSDGQTPDNGGQDASNAGNDFSATVTDNNPRKTAKSGAPTDELLDIKQDALQALTPLVDHLDQTPEERFRTTMMMIQASDNFSLIKAAYDAAGQINNEKERAQALLDIVNEINYFTQQQG